MQETINYPIYLFEEPILIPKTQEEAKELIDKIEILIDKYKTSRKIKSKAYNLCCEYFEMSLKLNLDSTLQFSMLRQDTILVKFVFDDRESEFIKRLRKYNEIFRDKGRAEFQYLFMKTMRNRGNLSLEDEVVQMFYSSLSKISNFQEEITEDNKFKITYQIGNQV